MAVLIDTSVGSIFFRRQRRSLSAAEDSVRFQVRDLLASGEGLLPWPVVQELLSGIRTDGQYRELLLSLRAVTDVPCTRTDFERAAQFFNRCVDAGLAASDLDMLICAVSERIGEPIYTLDADFQRYSELLGIALYEP